MTIRSETKQRLKKLETKFKEKMVELGDVKERLNLIEFAFFGTSPMTAQSRAATYNMIARERKVAQDQREAQQKVQDEALKKIAEEETSIKEIKEFKESVEQGKPNINEKMSETITITDEDYPKSEEKPDAQL